MVTLEFTEIDELRLRRSMLELRRSTSIVYADMTDEQIMVAIMDAGIWALEQKALRRAEGPARIR
jgi:hypothetical protein